MRLVNYSKLIPKDRCQLIADRERGVTWQKRKGTDSIPRKVACSELR
jgi:hypothetical protein